MSGGPQLTLVVAARTIEADDIIALDLRATNSCELPAFTPGSHIDVELPNGMVRQYSLFNSHRERHRYCIAALREPCSKGGSIAIHDSIGVGSSLRVSEPRNLFRLHQKRLGNSILLAAGIGITPLLSMAEELSTLGASFALHYTAKTRSKMAFQRALLAGRLSPNVHLYFSRAEPSSRLDLKVTLANPNTLDQLYVCGPSSFINAAVNEAEKAGWKGNHIHREFFAADPKVIQQAGTDFQVRVARTDQVYKVPSDKSIAEVLLQGGVALTVSCSLGVCGTCLTRVIAGTPDHRDIFLTDAEHDANDQMTPCCSRSKTPLLVLDL